MESQTDPQPTPQTDWHKAFAISHVTREDLVAVEFPRHFVAAITDEQMERIAKKMGDLYNDYGYHEDVINAVHFVIGFSETDEEGMQKQTPIQTTRSSKQIHYPVLVLNRSELRRLLGMSADRLTEADISEVAQQLTVQLADLGVWDECIRIATDKLAEKTKV